MEEAAALLYLEADDEVTTVVRRLRTSTEARVVVVAPGRSRATSSVVALRLLARVAAEEGREIAVVGDALTRSLAAEAGLAAYLSVDDARRAEPVYPAVSPPRRAGIHVVRGRANEEAAPTMAAAPMPAADAAWAETRSHPAPAAHPRPTRSGLLQRRFPLLVAAAMVAVLLLATGVAGVVLLPAATVTIVPATRTIPARTYTILLDGEADGAVRRTGTAEGTATVTATGTYPIREQATGTVTFFNYNDDAVEVPAGTLVAASEQAFQTVTPIVVPAGSLTPQGTILAGEASVPVMASAPGTAGNVPARAIDTVLSEGPRNSLRAFANNASKLVENPSPTSGGDERTGPEILQADVDAAVALLRAALAAEVETALGDGDVIRVPVAPAEPAFEGLDDLVGTRDQPAVEIRGTLAYDTWLVDRARLDSAAADRLSADRTAVPDGFRLVADETAVEVTGTMGTAEGVEASVAVRGYAVADIDPDAVLERIRGTTPDEAEALLADIGRARIDVWPDWVTTITELDWRIRVVVEAADDPPAEPDPSASP
jgi:hypothetical protein